MFKYEGNFDNGIKSSKEASGSKFTISGMCQYEGNFTNGEITGTGIRKWDDGRSYKGEFVDGEMTGNLLIIDLISNI